MKKIVSLILVLAVFLPLFGLYANAEENVQFKVVEISTGENTYYEKVFVQDEEIYVLAESFPKYTNYKCIRENDELFFIIKGQENWNATRRITVNAAEKTLLIHSSIANESKKVDLQDCLELEGALYLPFCQMLPMMNASIFGVENGVIQIANSTLSLLEVLYDFHISDYYFNLSEEFLDSDALALTYILPAYLFDTVVSFKWTRLTPAGEQTDFQDIFKELLLENDVYLDAQANSSKMIGEVVEEFKNLDGTFEKVNSIFGWIKAAGESDVSAEQGGILLEGLKALYVDGELESELLYQFTNTWKKGWIDGKISFSDCVKILDYAYTCSKISEEQHELLVDVYDINKKKSVGAEQKAAAHVYRLYKEQAAGAIVDETFKSLVGEGIEAITCPKIYSTTLKCAKMVFDEILPFDASDVSTIHLSAGVVLTAEGKHLQTGLETDEDVETKINSLLLCALASRRCFDIMRSTATASSPKYYENKIAKLEKLIIALTMAKDSILFDSYEHFSEHQKENLKKIKENLPRYQDYSGELPEESIGNLFDIANFEKSSTLKSNISSNYAVDGQHLYVISEEPAGGPVAEGTDGYVSTFINKYRWDGTAEKIEIDYDPMSILYYEDFFYLNCRDWSRESGYDNIIIKLDRNWNFVEKVSSSDNILVQFCIVDDWIYVLKYSSYNRNYYLCRVDINGDNADSYDWINATRFLHSDGQNIYLLKQDSVRDQMQLVKFDTKSVHKPEKSPLIGIPNYSEISSAVIYGKKVYICIDLPFLDSENGGILCANMDLSEMEWLETSDYSAIALRGDELIALRKGENVAESFNLKTGDRHTLTISKNISDSSVFDWDVLGDYALFSIEGLWNEGIVCKLNQ